MQQFYRFTDSEADPIAGDEQDLATANHLEDYLAIASNTAVLEQNKDVASLPAINIDEDERD